MRLNPGMSNPEYALGSNEESVQAAFGELLRPGAVVYDVEASIGFVTLVFARLVGEAGQVYAFEPDLDNAALVRSNVLANGIEHVLVVCRAVAASSGAGSLALDAYSGGHALSSVAPPPAHIATVPVEVVSLDDFVALGGPRPQGGGDRRRVGTIRLWDGSAARCLRAGRMGYLALAGPAGRGALLVKTPAPSPLR